MSKKTLAELEAELEDLREALLIALSHEGSLQYFDIMFIAQRVQDIKQEMRLARARG